MYRKQAEFCRCFSCEGILYQVKKGDTLFAISRRFEVALEDLMDANPFIDVYRLMPGMQVCVPVREDWDELNSDEADLDTPDLDVPDSGGPKPEEINSEKIKAERINPGKINSEKKNSSSSNDVYADRKPWSWKGSEREKRYGQNERSNTYACPYGLCGDPMQFDETEW